MALVSYGVDSDDYSGSDTEIDKGHVIEDPIILLPKASKVPTSVASVEDDKAPLMPRKPWEKEMASKPVKGKVKISLPSLPEYNDDDSDEEMQGEKKTKMGCSKGGATKLLSMLPAPATSTPKGMMLPNSLSRKQVAPKPHPKILPPPSKKLKEVVIEEDEDVDGDFFGFQSKHNTVATGPVMFEGDLDYGPSRPPNVGPMAFGEGSVNDNEIHASQMYNMANVVDYSTSINVPSSSQSSAVASEGRITDEKAREMIRKWELESSGVEGDLGETDFVDVSVDKRLGNIRENILKNLSGQADVLEQVKKREELEKSKPEDLAKRKHQITYLAYMAKQKEESLKDQWSANKYSRRQTQQKYGF